jgi:hypothetical protein
MIEDLMVTRPTDFRRPGIRNFVESYTETREKPGPEYIGTDLFQTLYEMKLTLVVSFYSNGAQFEHKREDAFYSLKRHLYDDVIRELADVITISQDPDVSSRLRGIISQLTTWDSTRHTASVNRYPS